MSFFPFSSAGDRYERVCQLPELLGSEMDASASQPKVVFSEADFNAEWKNLQVSVELDFIQGIESELNTTKGC